MRRRGAETGGTLLHEARKENERRGRGTYTRKPNELPNSTKHEEEGSKTHVRSPPANNIFKRPLRQPEMRVDDRDDANKGEETTPPPGILEGAKTS